MKIRCLKYIGIIPLLVLGVLAMWLFLFDKRNSTPPAQEKILVQINDTTSISVNEFLRRAEYTIRPAYCKRSDYISKKIILNSLIAEKLMALAAVNNIHVTQNEPLENYLAGRKEQAMRQWMVNQESVKKVGVSQEEIDSYYPRLGREYEIESLVISDSLMNTGIRFDQTVFSNMADACSNLSGSNIPVQHVKWTREENSELLGRLYGQDIKKGQVLSPFKHGYKQWLWVRVKGWSDSKAVTSYQREQREESLKEILMQIKVKRRWDTIVSKIMKGRSIQFNSEITAQVAGIFKQRYFDAQDNKFKNKTVWDKDQSLPQIIDARDEQALMPKPFFKVDGKTWSVEDFRNVLNRHPLVYRKKKMASNEFGHHFQLAVVDMIRDHFVTQAAYGKGYDKVAYVKKNVQMWRDSFAAYYQKETYLCSLGITGLTKDSYMDVLEERLNPYVDSLQALNYKTITLDIKAFEAIQLTHIDLFVKQEHLAYPQVVPLFPMLTTDHFLEYVDEMYRK
ncbi:hypothetical protein KAR48_16815 [bacterium]|nr:hypothetical protein [bacterium]